MYELDFAQFLNSAEETITMENKSREHPALILLPNLLGEHRDHHAFLPISVDQAVATLDGLIAESVKEGRRFLSRFKLSKPTHLIPLALLNEHTPEADLDFLLEPICKGERWGLVSDCGLPCIADPGANLVRRAYALNLQVEALIGPSSLALAQELSGLPCQQFTFHGYLDRDPIQRKKQIQTMEQAVQMTSYTQLFIETPYRNMATLQTLIDTLANKRRLCIACDLTLPTQKVITQTIAAWKNAPLPDIDNSPAIFLIK
jgi:16S rRNA (cytidine1402-2'-O)-methyltransferase